LETVARYITEFSVFSICCSSKTFPYTRCTSAADVAYRECNLFGTRPIYLIGLDFQIFPVYFSLCHSLFNAFVCYLLLSAPLPDPETCLLVHRFRNFQCNSLVSVRSERPTLETFVSPSSVICSDTLLVYRSPTLQTWQIDTILRKFYASLLLPCFPWHCLSVQYYC
jgi:hypothetical protein